MCKPSYESVSYVLYLLKKRDDQDHCKNLSEAHEIALKANLCRDPGPTSTSVKSHTAFHPNKLYGFCNSRLTSCRKRATVAP